MKKWYLYKNDYNIGIKDTKVEALRALEYFADKKITRTKIPSLATDAITLGYIRIWGITGNKYEAKLEEVL